MKLNWKVWKEIIGYLSVFIVSLIVSTIVFIVINFFRFGEISSASDLNVNTVTLVGIVFSLLIYMLVIHKEKKVSLWKYCGFRKINFTDICLAIGLGIILSLCIGLIIQVDFLQQLSSNHDDKISNDLKEDSILFVILLTGILIPLIEEIIFRGLLYQTLKNSYSMTAAIILQAVIFAIIHIDPLQIIYTFLLALFFVRLVVRVNSLWASILMHASFNVTTIIMLRIIKENESVFLFLLLVVFAIVSFSIGLGSRMVNKKNGNVQ